MGDAAGAGRAAGDLAGIGLGVGDEALEVVDAELAAHGKHFLDAHHQDLRREVLGRIERHLGHQALHDGAGRGAHQPHDMRVGARLGDEVDPGHARRPALVLDHHGLAQQRRHGEPKVAPEDVRGAAGREGHDEGEGLGGKGRLGFRRRKGGRCKGQGSQPANGDTTRNTHDFLRFVAQTVRKERRGGKGSERHNTTSP